MLPTCHMIHMPHAIRPESAQKAPSIFSVFAPIADLQSSRKVRAWANIRATSGEAQQDVRADGRGDTE